MLKAGGFCGAVAAVLLGIGAICAPAPVSAGPQAAPSAGDWIYPSRNYRDDGGRWVYPTTDGRRFQSVFEREAYLRESRDIRGRARAAEAAADRRRGNAAADRRAIEPRIVTVPPTRLIPIERLGDEREERRRMDRAAAMARQQARQQRLQRFLDAQGRAGAAGSQADLAAERAARARRLARTEDRLYGGAAAARQTLGERERRPIGPLIRAPRVVTE